MVHLVDVGPDNWRLGLQVSESQKRYVTDSAGILARAYAYRDFRSRAFAICDGDTPVGMGLYYDLPDMEYYDFSQIFIDERFQGNGYGKAAVKLVLEEMRQDGRFSKVDLCYIEGNLAARRLYEELGFVETERDGDEIIMEMKL